MRATGSLAHTVRSQIRKTQWRSRSGGPLHVFACGQGLTPTAASIDWARAVKLAGMPMDAARCGAAGGRFQGMSPPSSHWQGGRSRSAGAGAPSVLGRQQLVAADSPAMLMGAQQGEASAIAEHERAQELPPDQKGKVARSASSVIMVERFFIAECVASIDALRGAYIEYDSARLRAPWNFYPPDSPGGAAIGG